MLARWTSHAVLPLALLFGCSRAPELLRRTFEPGERSARVTGVTLDVLQVEYVERGVDLRLMLANKSAEPTTVSLRGMLLAYGELEFPIDGPQRQDEVELAAGQERELSLTFTVGGRLLDDALLMVRAVEHAGQDLEPMAIPIPASPVVNRAQQ